MEVLESTINELEQKMLRAGELSGVPSGFNELDAVTGGWQKSDLIILAARPGMGKTAFALNCAAIKQLHASVCSGRCRASSVFS